MFFLTVSLLYKEKPEVRAHDITVHSGPGFMKKEKLDFQSRLFKSVVCEDNMLIPYRHCLPSYETQTWGDYRYYTKRCVVYHRVDLLASVVLGYRCLLWEGVSCNLSSDGRRCNYSGYSRFGYKAGGHGHGCHQQADGDERRLRYITKSLPPFFYGNLFIDCTLADTAETTSGTQSLHQCNWQVFHERAVGRHQGWSKLAQSPSCYIWTLNIFRFICQNRLYWFFAP